MYSLTYKCCHYSSHVMCTRAHTCLCVVCVCVCGVCIHAHARTHMCTLHSQTIIYKLRMSLSVVVKHKSSLKSLSTIVTSTFSQFTNPFCKKSINCFLLVDGENSKLNSKS